MNSAVVSRSLAQLLVASVGALILSLACTTTLDPSLTVEGQAGTTGEAPLSSCPFLIVSQAGRRYLVCQSALEFQAAANDCARHNATLAAVSSQGENEVVVASAALILKGDVWLGGSLDDSEAWRWPDGSVFWRGGRDGAAENGAFVRWANTEPNEGSPDTGGSNSCLSLNVDSKDWSARACSLSLPYVCESN